MKKIILLILLCVALFSATQTASFTSAKQIVMSPFSEELSASDKAIKNAFETQRKDFQVGGSGTVVKVLKDDTEGRQHQRFILKLKSGQTLLVAHNIDIAPRLTGLSEGDHVNFYGEYEWTEKGGVLHWTHHDPSGRHVGGWLNHGGKIYQ